MAKDPAFLFYPGDWQGGTMYMTHEEKGCYIDLLILQFNVGKFTEAQAKQVLSICFPVAWATLKQKFCTDGIFFWNQRLLVEIEKRKKFSESRRINAQGTKKQKKEPLAYAKHMENENINEDEIKIVSINTIERKNEFLKNQIWKEKFCMAKKIELLELETLMQEFISDCDLKGQPVDSYRKYFTNWFNKKQNETHKRNYTRSSERPGTSEARINKAKNWGHG